MRALFTAASGYYASVMLGLALRPMTTGLGLEDCGRGLGLEGHGIGLGLGTHVRLVTGDTRVFEVQ